jgi:DNA-binding transcriptional LysR family regulator
MSTKNLYRHVEKLWILRVLVQHGSFKEAAAITGVTSSAISQSLSALEAAVGKRLLVRDKGAPHPTPYCLKMLEAVAPAFEILDRASMLQKPGESLKLVRLRVGAYESIAVNFFPSLFPTLQAKHPELKLSVRTARSGILCSLVRSGDLDLALVIENDLIRNLDSTTFAEDTLGLFARPDHPVFRNGWASLSTYPLGGLSSGKDGVPRYYRRFLQSIGSAIAPTMECDSLETLRELAAQGALISILPSLVAHRKPGELAQLAPPPSIRLDSGLHKLCLISRKGISNDAKLVLQEELARILKLTRQREDSR